MQLVKYLTLAAVSVSLASAQAVNNASLFDLVASNNSNWNISKFAGLLSSDPGYQPIIQLLQQPGNYTAFVPNDRAVDKALRMFKSYARSHRLSYRGNYPPANFTFNNLSVADVISYHVANTNVTLANFTANANILYSLLNKTGVDKIGFGSGLPLLIENNATFAQLTNDTWIAANKSYLEWEVGNGAQDAEVLRKDIAASNGYLNIIDSVLIPPMSPTVTINEEDDLETLAGILKKYPEIGRTLNSTSNFTLFAPDDEAFRKVNLRGLSEQNVTDLLLAHVVPGVYYSTNITEAAANNTLGPLTSLSGTTIPIAFDNMTGAVTLNNTIHVVEANIFFNNGVMHIINGTLSGPTN